MSFLDEAMNSIMNEMQKNMKESEKRISRALKNYSDDEILRAIRNIESQGKQNDYRYHLICEEADRRGL